MLKLTQCLIIKNEAHNLPRALSWGRGVADECVVVDTGSDDGSPALARKLGAKVLSFPWNDDFSAARNYAISQCTGDWILFLDADEYFTPEDAVLLRPLLARIDGRFNVVESPWLNPGSVAPAKQVRIFRNDLLLRYAGAVHEQLHALPGGSLTVYRGEDVPAIHHTGYVWTDDNRKQAKAARNFAAAEKALKSDPGCAKLWLFAAEALMNQGKCSEAEPYFARAMQNADGSIWPQRLREGYKQWLHSYRLRDDFAKGAPALLKQALAVYKQAAAKYPEDPDFDVLISLLFYKAQDVLNTMRFFAAALEKDGKISESLIDPNGETFKQLKAACEELKKANII